MIFWFHTDTYVKSESENSYRKRKRSPDESHTQTQTHGNLIYFGDHRCLSQSEEIKYMWTCSNNDTTWVSHGFVITTCSHIFNLFWSRKASVITKIYQVSMCLCLCVTFIWRSLNFLVRVFSFFSYVLCYQYFGSFLSTWPLM